MRKCLLMLLLMLLLGGCGTPVDYETMSDVYVEAQMPQASDVRLLLPSDAAAMALGSEDAGTIYLCDGYSVVLQTRSAGDLDATLRAVTGYSREGLSVMERQVNGVTQYECVWVSAGEGGDQVGRAAILDDGNYHYCLSLLTDAQTAGDLAQTWKNILDSFSLDIAS